MTYSIESVLNLLSLGFMGQFDIPNDYLLNSDINEALQKYNWSTRPAHIFGWTTLIKQRNYSS
jgi:hypothetical protein